MDVGFVGVGSMGAAMIPHLLEAGHRVSVWNRNPAAGEALEGVSILSSPAAAFENEAVLTMLADDAAVRSVILDSDALASARDGCVHVMMATISLAIVDELIALHARLGVPYVAAPVFGNPSVAAARELNVLAAGDPNAVARVEPLLEALGQKVWHLGDDPRHANIVKIAGNMMITLAIEAMGEGAGLVESYGVKTSDFLNVITNTMFASPAYKRYGGNIANGTYDPGFKMTLGLKDVRLALSAAEAKHVDLPAAEVVEEHMLAAVDRGLGSKDWSAFATAPRERLDSALRR